MSEVQALEKARRRMATLLSEQPRDALAAMAAEDPLNLRGRGAQAGDDEGRLLDPGDLMIDGYVHIARKPAVLDDLTGWLVLDLPRLVQQLAQEPPSAALTDAIGRAVGIEDEDVEAWAGHFRALSLHDRRDVLALLRGGSDTFRAVYPGRAFHFKRDIIEVQRTFSIFRALIKRTQR
jgi:hypothetical protein